MIESDSPVVAFSYQLTEESYSSLFAQEPSDDDELMAPHFFVSCDGTSLIQLVNLGTAKASVELEALDDNGGLIGSAQFQISPGTGFAADGVDLLDIDRDLMGPLETTPN